MELKLVADVVLKSSMWSTASYSLARGIGVTRVRECLALQYVQVGAGWKGMLKLGKYTASIVCARFLTRGCSGWFVFALRVTCFELLANVYFLSA